MTLLWYISVLRFFCATFLCYAFVLRLFYVTSLILPEISVQLPLPDLADVLLPLLALRIQIALVDVLAQRLKDHRILLQIIERFMQVPGKIIDAILASLAVRHARDVLVHGLAGIDPLVDAIQTGGELPGDVPTAHLGEVDRPFGVEERVLPFGE